MRLVYQFLSLELLRKQSNAHGIHFSTNKLLEALFSLAHRFIKTFDILQGPLVQAFSFPKAYDIGATPSLCGLIHQTLQIF